MTLFWKCHIFDTYYQEHEIGYIACCTRLSRQCGPTIWDRGAGTSGENSWHCLEPNRPTCKLFYALGNNYYNTFSSDSRTHESLVRALVYNSQNQIFNISSGETIAEFDALLTLDGCRYLVEITDTENKPLIKELEYDSLRKFNLMRILFPGERLGYWIITTYQHEIDVGALPNVFISRTPKYRLDPDILRGLGKPDVFPTPVLSKFKTIYQVKHQSFDYLAVMQFMHNEILSISPSVARRRLRPR